MTIDLSSFLVTGTDDPAKQVSVEYQNNFVEAVESGINAGGSSLVFNVADYLSDSRTPNVTDDLPAFDAALAAIKAATANNAGGGQLYIPAGRYYLSDALNVHCSVYIYGDGNGQGNSGTLLRFGKNCNGIVFNHGNTHDDTTGTQGSATGSKLEGVSLWGGNINVDGAGTVTDYSAGDSTTGHGVRIRTTFVALVDVFSAFFGGDGFNIECTAGGGGATEGNANDFYLERCQSTYNGRYGYVTSGADANAGTFNTCSAISNAGCGFLEYAFLGNTYIQCHARDSGAFNPVIDGGRNAHAIEGIHKYYALADQIANASTSQPSLSPSVWVQADGLSYGRVWVSGQEWLIPGAYVTNPGNANSDAVFIGCYAEDSQGPVQAGGSALFMGGNVTGGDFASGSGGGQLYATRGGLGSKVFIAYSQDTARMTAIGPVSGITSPTTVFYSAFGAKSFRIDENGANDYAFINNGAYVAAVTPNGFNVPSSKAYYVNDIKVVGSQGAAVADATGGATVDTEARAAINAVIARLEAHGLIAT